MKKEKNLLSLSGLIGKEQVGAKKCDATEKQIKPIIYKEDFFLSEYRKEILQLSKYLSKKIIKSLLEELRKHPVDIVDCIKKTNELSKKQIIKNNSILIGVKNIDEFIDEVARSPKDFLLLLAYCSKPLNCPFGRFCEKCEPFNHLVCSKCSFKEVVLKTKKIGCRCFIITRDNLMFSRYLLPRFYDFINHRKYKPLLTIGCALATNRFLRTAVIFGSIVMAYKFINGSCKNLKDYNKAEAGVKNKVTKLNQKNWKEINYILDKAFIKIQYIKSHKYDNPQSYK